MQIKYKIKSVITCLALLSFVTLYSNTKAYAWFGDTLVLGKILGVNIEQKIDLMKTLEVARQHLATLRDLLGSFKKAYGGIDLPQDFIPWDKEVLNELSFKHDPRLEQVVETIKSSSSVVNSLRDISLKDVVNADNLQDLISLVKDTWNIGTNLPGSFPNRQDAVSTLVALQSFDASRRSLPLLPDISQSLESILPEVNKATPGRSIQLNTHLNFLQAAGLEHLVETQAAATQMSAINLLNEQEKTKANYKAVGDIYSALAAISDKEMKIK